MSKEELELILVVLEQAKIDAQTVHFEFMSRGDPLQADTADIDEAIAIIQSKLDDQRTASHA